VFLGLNWIHLLRHSFNNMDVDLQLGLGCTHW
jgi:hypothetical protein